MGYLQDDHIQKFCKGQIIKSMRHDGRFTFFNFQSGFVLRIYVDKNQIIATPLDKDGKCVQSTEIMKVQS